MNSTVLLHAVFLFMCFRNGLISRLKSERKFDHIPHCSRKLRGESECDLLASQEMFPVTGMISTTRTSRAS
nr:PREDICTED: uncharacterized protein LOC109034684 isoform X2 [Bemisia tabaci]